MDKVLGIELVVGDTRERCTSGLSFPGRSYRCDYAAEHDGWAHSSREAQALWADDVKWVPVDEADTDV